MGQGGRGLGTERVGEDDGSESLEEHLDLEDARVARSEAQEKGTIPLADLKKELGF